MGLNLHALVRPIITTVNPDTGGQWVRSAGYTVAEDGSQVPAYAAPAAIDMQVQSLTGRDLRHKDLLNVQGVLRKVYLFGNVQGVVRVDAKGGDLLVFPQERGGATFTWLIKAVLETWQPTAPGWCCVAAVLQS